jgi:hypothetical protein
MEEKRNRRLGARRAPRYPCRRLLVDRAIVLRRRTGVGAAAGMAGLLFATVARVGDKLGFASSPDFGWKQWSLLAAGLGLLATAGVLLAPAAVALARERGFAPAPAVPAPSGLWRGAAILALAVAGIVLVWTRLVTIDQSLWHDEAFSVIHYARGGPRAILGSQEYVPNDHVLFNLLSWATAHTLGDWPASRRLWAVFPALAAVALVGAWTWRRLGAGVAVAVVILTVASPVYEALATLARGYGLTFFCAAAMLVTADRMMTGGGRAALAGFAAAAFAGVATLPVFALTVLAQAAPLVVRPRLRERTLIALGAVGVASVALYWSVLEDVLGNAGQQFGVRVPWHGPVTRPLDTFVGPVVAPIVAVAYHPTAAWRLIAATLLAVGFILLVRRGETPLAGLLATPMVGVYGLLALGRFHVEDTRFTSFLLFYALVPVAVAAAWGVEALKRPRMLRPALTATAVTLGVLALGHAIDVAKVQAARPLEAFDEVADVVRGTGIQRVVSDTRRPEGWMYAMGDQSFSRPPAAELQRLLCQGPRPLVYISHPFGATPAAPAPQTNCIARRGAARVRILQRSRGGYIDVWILPAR